MLRWIIAPSPIMTKGVGPSKTNEGAGYDGEKLGRRQACRVTGKKYTAAKRRDFFTKSYFTAPDAMPLMI
jgi:hypothetical protein